MTAQPWQPMTPSTVRAYHRTDEAGNLLAYIAETGSAWSAYYGPGLTRRGCDDLISAARCANAGLRLLGFDCDDGVPDEPT
jgi:hypothetical protein